MVMPAAELAARVDALDTGLFRHVETQTSEADRRALLALHASIAGTLGEFRYLEIGSYLGGSLQVLVRDPRCTQITSIDLRPAAPPDKRSGTWSYGDNSTSRMLSLLRVVPGADVDKLSTFEVGADALHAGSLPASPDLCFVDGEHTDEAVLRDARFCARAVDGTGVVAFHDELLVRPGIYNFLREVWDEVSHAAVLSRGDPDGGGVFAVEFGDAGVLGSPAVKAAIDSTWHRLAWRLASDFPHSPMAVRAIGQLMPLVDRTILDVRRRLSRPR
jgi:Methyltransferase domain